MNQVEMRWGRRNTAGVAIASSLSLRSVSRVHDGNVTLDGVAFDVERGETLCLLGPSGSGKTTLLRMIAGIEPLDGGEILIDERIASNGTGVLVPPEKRGVGMVFQDFALFPHLSVLDNVRFALRRAPRSVAKREAMNMLSRVGMERRANAFPHSLSGGERQRAALARALAPRPSILLMDEPFSGLDSRMRDFVREETSALLRDTLTTAVIVTHDPEEAMRVGDRIALIREGRLVQHGTGKELHREPADLFAARFFSELNLLRAEIIGGKAATPFGSIPAEGFKEGEEARVGVRLSDVRLRPLGAEANALGEGEVAGRIASRRFLGESEIIELHVQEKEQPLRARLPAGALQAEALDVAVSVNADSTLLFPAE